MGWELAAILAAGLFAGASVYINLVEHPARVQGGTALAVTAGGPRPQRATVMQVALAVIGRQFGLLVWPVTGAAAVMGFLAWRLYAADGAEHSLLRAIAAAILTAIAIFGLIVPSLPQLFPSAALVRVLHDSGCAQPSAAAVGYQEPSLVFLAGSDTRLTDTVGAVDFLRAGECRFAFVEARQERSFAQRAEALGLRYTAGPRIEAINVSNGQPITIAVYRSVGRS